VTWTPALTLPHGALLDGRLDREVEVRVPTGADELHVLGRARTRAEQISALLERCTIRLGVEAPPPGAVRSLVAGDREALLLHLRATAFGRRLDCVVDCPTCGEAMDLELSIDELLVEPYADPPHDYGAVVEDGQRVRFRLPTGRDLEAAARSTTDPERAASALLERCVVEAPGGSDARMLPDGARDELARRMADLDPQAEVALVMSCPECGAAVRAVLDAAGALLDELASDEDELFGEIHALALHYHWSERDILALEVPRRRRYLDLLADSLGAEP
jgi:hypothetical protein